MRRPCRRDTTPRVGRIVRRRTRFRGRLFTVATDRLCSPSGRHERRDVVIHPGAAAVLPVLPDGRVLLVRQYRHPVERSLWEIPAGTLEPGETPETCARRELLEETGHEPGRLSAQGAFHSSPGYTTERIQLFVAYDARRVSEPTGEHEISAVGTFTEDDLLSLLRAGELVDGKSWLALSLHYRWGWPGDAGERPK